MRLEPGLQAKGWEDYEFQFHKGAIRTAYQKQKQLTEKYFNSIKVRLEPYNTLCNAEKSSFQFHKGAIRTDKVVLDLNAGFQFQFHKGAIRTTQNCGEFMQED